MPWLPSVSGRTDPRAPARRPVRHARTVARPQARRARNRRRPVAVPADGVPRLPAADGVLRLPEPVPVRGPGRLAGGEGGRGAQGQAGRSAVVPEPPKKEQPNNDAFGNMLSQVSGDSTLNVKTEVEKPAVQKPVLVVGSAAIVKNETIPQRDSIENNTIKDTPIVESKMGLPLYNNNALVKIKEVTTNDGTDMVFLDSSSGLNDTIRIFLPAQPALTDAKEVQTKIPEKGSVIESAKIDSNANVKEVNSVVVKQPDTSASENGGVNNPFFAKENQKKIDTNVMVQSGNVSSNSDNNAAPANMASSTECKNMLTESDMSKLRKKMVVAESDDKMINIVKKNIGDKCISTDQVKNLSALFLSDDGRLNFFSSVYTLVYDKSAFSSLESQLIDPNYKKRFKDLIK